MADHGRSVETELTSKRTPGTRNFSTYPTKPRVNEELQKLSNEIDKILGPRTESLVKEPNTESSSINQMGDYREEIDKLVLEIKELKQAMPQNDLVQEVEGLKKTIDSVKKELKIMDRNFQKLDKKVEGKEDTSPTSSTSVQAPLPSSVELEDINQLKNLVHQQAITIAHLEKQVASLKNEMKHSLGSLQPTIEPFLALGSAVDSCESTKELVKNYFPLEKTENAVLFVGLVGRDRGFANEIYNTMKKFKCTKKTPISPSEESLLATVNSFYRNRDNIDFDVLLVPEPLGRFNKQQVQDLEKPGNTSFRQYSEVYVPIVMKDGNSVGFRGIVKGKS